MMMTTYSCLLSVCWIAQGGVYERNGENGNAAKNSYSPLQTNLMTSRGTPWIKTLQCNHPLFHPAWPVHPNWMFGALPKNILKKIYFNCFHYLVQSNTPIRPTCQHHIFGLLSTLQTISKVPSLEEQGKNIIQ